METMSNVILAVGNAEKTQKLTDWDKLKMRLKDVIIMVENYPDPNEFSDERLIAYKTVLREMNNIENKD
jgi:hypothetical protein